MESIFHSNGTRRLLSPDSWHPRITSRYRAIIFDCDGTLVESSEVHFKSFQSAVQAQGQDMMRDWYLKRTGLDRRSLFATFSTQVSSDLDVDLAIRESIQNFIDLSSTITSIKETAKLLQALEKTHRLAVATNAELEVATASLRATNLLKYFEFIVSISDGVICKPSPDMFLLAIERLGFQASEILVFEDSEEGVNGAREAGLDVIQVMHK